MNALQVEKADLIVDSCREFITGYAGTNFLTDVSLFLAEQLGVSYVLIGHLLPGDTNKIKTVVLIAKGNVVDNMTYALYGTPCENVVGRNCCYFPAKVQALFPDDKELQDLNIESYIGSPLFRSTGEPLGLVVLMNETIIKNAQSVEKALAVLSPRVQEELAKYLD